MGITGPTYIRNVEFAKRRLQGHVCRNFRFLCTVMSVERFTPWRRHLTDIEEGRHRPRFTSPYSTDQARRRGRLIATVNLTHHTEPLERFRYRLWIARVTRAEERRKASSYDTHMKRMRNAHNTEVRRD